MAIRVYTKSDVNVLFMQQIKRYVKRDMHFVVSNGPWILDSEGRLTLLESGIHGQAFFRMMARRGSGMLKFDLEPMPDTYIESKVYHYYHKVMVDFLYSRFGGRFYLLEQTPYEDRRPRLDDVRLRIAREIYPNGYS